jgi:hypothetical protein
MSAGQLDVGSLNDRALVRLIPVIIREMKSRRLIRSNNIVGDLGEYLALDTYNSGRGLPKLQQAPRSTKNVDAIGRDGERYSIKTVKLPNRTTSVFWGLQEPESKAKDSKKFERVIIVILDEDWTLVELLEISWETFLGLKKWHSRMRAWNISVTNRLRKSATRVIKNPLPDP